MEKNVHEIEKVFKGEKWTKLLDEVFNKKKKDIKMDGFRKGAVPKDIYLKKVGVEVLYPDAVDLAINEGLGEILKEGKVIPVIEPKVAIMDINSKELKIKFTIITKPEIKLGEYKNLGIKKEEAKVSKEELDKEVKRLQSKYAEIVEKEKGKAENGNTAVIDFTGYVEGKELEGGKGENYPLELGSNTFIPGFEEAVVGMKIGEEKEINLTFPDNYTENLRNKDVTFKVKLQGLKERVLPEINEEFFQDLGYDDVKTVEDFHQKVEDDLKKVKEKELDDKYLKECLEKAVSNMEVNINQEIIDDEIHHMIHNMEERLQMQGLSLEQYMQFTGMKHEDLHNQFADDALNRIKNTYLLESVADQENIKIDDKQIDEEIKRLSDEYHMSEEDIVKEIGNREVIRFDLKMRGAMDIIKK